MNASGRRAKRARFAALERAAMLEELASSMRHDLRNRLAAIKNASFYLKQKTRTSLLWQQDKNVPRFYQVLEDELAAAGELIAKQLMKIRLMDGEIAAVRLQGCVEEALELARIPESIAIDRRLEDRQVLQADCAEVTLIARCLIDTVLETMPDGGRLAVRTFERDGQVVLEVGEPGPAGDDRGAFGLKIVRRLAARYGATLTLGRPLRVSFPYSEASLIVGT